MHTDRSLKTGKKGNELDIIVFQTIISSFRWLSKLLVYILSLVNTKTRLRINDLGCSYYKKMCEAETHYKVE